MIISILMIFFLCICDLDLVFLFIMDKLLLQLSNIDILMVFMRPGWLKLRWLCFRIVIS